MLDSVAKVLVTKAKLLCYSRAVKTRMSHFICHVYVLKLIRPKKTLLVTIYLLNSMA